MHVLWLIRTTPQTMADCESTPSLGYCPTVPVCPVWETPRFSVPQLHNDQKGTIIARVDRGSDQSPSQPAHALLRGGHDKLHGSWPWQETAVKRGIKL